jgi:hypothetical protein
MSKSSRFSWRNVRARNSYKLLLVLGLAYLAASIAIDRGSIWMYLLTFALCYVAIQYGVVIAKGSGSGKR